MSSRKRKLRKQHGKLVVKKVGRRAQTMRKRRHSRLSFGYDYDINKTPGLYLPKPHLTSETRHKRRFEPEWAEGDNAEFALELPNVEAADEIVQVDETSVFTDEENCLIVIVRDSCDVEIVNQDLTAALNLQLTLQLALATILSLTVGENTANSIVEDIVSQLSDIQRTRKVIHVENSQSVRVQLSSTEISFNIQVLLQLLLAIIAQVEVA
ncbi:spore coat protein [Alicyclobacillus suci]|uniref:spore coat protein n=1 Tax=Alicyclobacillus suci TaxID=2816080 RepID=UPI001A8F272B|nr:spore coat protein [Alicyclobacillus suci]